MKIPERSDTQVHGSRSTLTRRQMLRLLATGTVTAAGGALLAACGGTAPTTPPGSAPAQTSTRPLTPTFYQWIVDLHPSIPQVNSSFEGLNFQIAPVQGFGIERFVAEAKNKESTWDVYVGMTPFVEMSQLIKADVIEPWDDYIPKDVLDDILPPIREECTVNGKLYSWPFLLDVIGMAWNSNLTDNAGITTVPTTWDEYLANAKQVVDSGAAPYGATYDARGWRSLAPFTHSMSTNVYTPEGLFDFTSEPAVEALILMKKIKDLANPDILNEGTTDGGVNNTPDEGAFAAQQVAYYTKYFNAPLRFAQTGGFSDKLRMAGLPRFANSQGGTVFWTTGACLFKYGKNKEKAVEYMRALTYNQQIWKDSIAGSPTAHPGQLPPYKSIYAEWEANKPDWMQPFVALVREQFERARAITNHPFGLTQFVIGKPFWEEYLTGKESDPRAALQKAKDAVAAEIAKAG